MKRQRPKIRKCCMCQKLKQLTEVAFAKSKSDSQGFDRRCRLCVRMYLQRWNENLRLARMNPENPKHKYLRQRTIHDRIPRAIFQARSRCRLLGLPYDLDDHLPEIRARLAKGKCEVTNLRFVITAKNKTPLMPSLDRIVPNRGYVYSNIRIVCWAVNMMMCDWGESAVEPIITRWANVIKRRQEMTSRKNKP